MRCHAETFRLFIFLFPMKRTKFPDKKIKKEITNEIDYSLEDEPLVFSMALMDLLLSDPNPSDLLALYSFYYYTAKWQKTNQPKATGNYCRNAMRIGYDRMHKAQKRLIELKLIEKIGKRDSYGRIKGWYIKVNFLWKRDTVKKNNFIPDSPKEIKMEYSPDYVWKEFSDIKSKMGHIKIYKRDNWHCVYCGNKVQEIKNLYKQGKTVQEIALYVKDHKHNIATIDHILPISAGGDNSEENLVTSCLSCNSSKKDKIINIEDYPERGLSSSGFQEPNALSTGNINALSTGIDIFGSTFPPNANNEKKLSEKEKRNLKYFPMAVQLSKIVKSTINIKHTEAQLKTWTNDIRLLEEINGVSFDRIQKALDWYADHAGEDYVPIIESGKALKEKYSKLEAAIQRNKNGRKPTKVLVGAFQNKDSALIIPKAKRL